MKKVVRLTESDLKNIVKRVLREASKDDINKEWNKGKIKGLYNFLKSSDDVPHDDLGINYDYLEYTDPGDEDYGDYQSYDFVGDNDYAGSIGNFVPGGSVDGKEIEDRWQDPIENDDDLELSTGKATIEDFDDGAGATGYSWDKSGKMDDFSGDELSDFYNGLSKDAKKRTTDLMYDKYGNPNVKESYIRNIVNNSVKKILRENAQRNRRMRRR